jgi:hypothetical protein
VLYVAEDRTQASLDGFWKTLTPEQVASIEAVALPGLGAGAPAGR